MSEMISVLEAQKTIFNTTPKAQIETINICDSNGRVLAKDILALRNQPPFHRVMMDGIAIDSSAKTNSFQIQGTQAAGDKQLTLKDSSDCIEVMTGAALPIGCDCVIQYEKVQINSNTAIINSQDISSMGNIHEHASDYKEGEVLIKAGTKINSPICAVIASQGKSKVCVYKLPKVVIISTGSELVELDNKIEPYQIYMSNSYSIESELKNYGLKDIERLHIPDDQEQTQKQIEKALKDFDILIMTGGVSKGKFDYIPGILDNLGVIKHFHKVKQKPGKPMWYGSINDKQVFALPGNPVSCLVCLRRYVIPALNTSQQLEALPVYGELTESIKFKPDLALFASVKAQSSPCGKLTFIPISTNSSGDFYAAGQSTGFIELPSDQEIFNPGEIFPYYSWL